MSSIRHTSQRREVIRVAKLNFIQAKHPQALSYVECRSEVDEERPTILEEYLMSWGGWVMDMFVALCTCIGFVVLALAVLAA